MSRDDAKRALETIKTIQNDKPDEYSDDLCTTVIERLMKRAVTDYKQILKDQQDNAIELWMPVDDRGEEVMPYDRVLSYRFYTKEGAEEWIYDRREAYPKMGYYNYEPRLFREVMDNEC